MLLLDALSNPSTRDDLLFILADLWEYEPDKATIDEPPDYWDYEPVGKGIPRDQRWRGLSRRNRKRYIKRYEIGQLPLSALVEFVNAFKDTVNLTDFLGSLKSLTPAEAGNSPTPLHAVTDGQTE
jgi:hypothetical protein